MSQRVQGRPSRWEISYLLPVFSAKSRGRSFAGVAAYCLHDTAMMAATAQAVPDLKRLAGGSAAGRRPPLCRESVQ